NRYFYKTILAVTTLVTINNPFPAMANDRLWIPLTNEPNKSAYLDMNSITQEGNTKTFWVYINVKQPTPYYGWSKILAEGVVDCSTKSTTYRQAQVYDRQNNLLETLLPGAIAHFNIGAIANPDPMNEDTADLVCTTN
ncbi:MAG: hypothetical protein SAK29_35420, partial [Scytonema sp. PMC 1069.18]|nr:hypothetical protein [Scytonema sp. PMC 1069.18]